jgi:hypothetical protein
MKSPLLLIACLFFSILITGCSSEQKENYLTNFKIKGKVKSLVKKEYKAIERFGEVEKESIIYSDEIRFNLDGNPVEGIHYNSDGGIDRKSTYEYDLDGDKVESTAYDSDGGIDGKSTYGYDEDGNEVERIDYNSDGGLENKVTYVYDDDGNKDEMNLYDSDGGLFLKSTYEYDEGGNKVKNITCNSDGIIESKVTYEYNDEVLNKLELNFYNSDGGVDVTYTTTYDEDGNEVEGIAYNSGGGIDGKSTYEYEYDIQGNWTLQVIFEDGVATSLEEREFEYYD